MALNRLFNVSNVRKPGVYGPHPDFTARMNLKHTMQKAGIDWTYYENVRLNFLNTMTRIGLGEDYWLNL